jgi:hypothetical protein
VNKLLVPKLPKKVLPYRHFRGPCLLAVGL